MGFDLGVWRSDKSLGRKEAGEIYVRLCGGSTVSSGNSPKVSAFYDEITRRYPEIDTLSEDEVDGSPWACALVRSGQYVLMTIVPSRAEELVEVVSTLARKHQLLCFNPQSNDVLVQAPWTM
jgi:hypothetical protein